MSSPGSPQKLFTNTHFTFYTAQKVSILDHIRKLKQYLKKNLPVLYTFLSLTTGSVAFRH